MRVRSRFLSFLMSPDSLKTGISVAILTTISVAVSFYLFDILGRDLSVPYAYNGGDDVWQLVLTKFVEDTGWVLHNQYLGAPDIASWHHNAAAQTSALHSVIMLGLSYFISDAVTLQQVYYLLNFPLIALTTFFACRLIGISRVPAVCVGLIMAYTNFRITQVLYAFLANYFMVPLGLVPIYWILAGEFEKLSSCDGNLGQRLAIIIRSKQFLLGCVFVMLLASSDGYYAFFELLLLGFACVIRVVRGALRSPLELFAPVVYILSVVGVALFLATPLNIYQKNHPEEFSPGGVIDPVLTKHSFEAEVYSSTLKMMITPQPDHRVPILAELGRKIIKTSDDARIFKNGRSMVSLGIVGSILLAIAFLMLAAPSAAENWIRRRSNLEPDSSVALFNAFLSTVLFVFLCSILGGVGTMIALVFPTIRAYDRFPLFLLFTVFIGGAYVASLILQQLESKGRIIFFTVLIAITVFVLLDQIPGNLTKKYSTPVNKFLAERNFVHGIEGSVDPGSMIYQYPYSQYLRNSPYYGWGSFAHVRLYLHSNTLKWSNGASKNSPVENWHLSIASLPFDDLLTEVQAAGFSGIVFDRTVVKDDEYFSITTILKERGLTVADDPPSKLAFTKLPSPGLKLEYSTDYKQANRLIVTDRSKIMLDKLPFALDYPTMERWLRDAYPGENSFTVERNEHPNVFISAAEMAYGYGYTPVEPISLIQGTLTCETLQNEIQLTLTNKSRFDWVLRSGAYPISVGIHLKTRGGELVSFDNGQRFPAEEQRYTSSRSVNEKVVKRQRTLKFSVPVADIKVPVSSLAPRTAEFVLVQDGHAWLNDISCATPLP